MDENTTKVDIAETILIWLKERYDILESEESDMLVMENVIAFIDSLLDILGVEDNENVK